MKLLASLLILISVQAAYSQTKPANFYDSARVYYQKKDFKKAYYFYDAYYSDPKHGQSNYDTFFAAVAGCQSGQTEKIGYYLRRSAEIGYDLSAYKDFAEDPLAVCLQGRPEWKAFIEPFKFKADSATKALKAINDRLNDTTGRVNHSPLTEPGYWEKLAAIRKANELMAKIQRFNQFPKLERTGFWTLYHLKVNDTLTVPYLVYIPQKYDPAKASSLYVYLHGGVTGGKNFPNPAYQPAKHAKLFAELYQQNALIIFPFANKSFNWLYHHEAFEAIISEVKQIKSLYNIDDNKVYLGGHSDGGRGAVWFAMNEATTFAGFYGICFFPSVYTGNSTLRNLHNQTPFYALSATDDQLFPIGMVNQVLDFDIPMGGNWHRHSIKGTHGLPYEEPDSVHFVFDSLAVTKRDPAPKKLTWETDDIRNGQYFWVSINQLDTAAAPAEWHKPLNPTMMNKAGVKGKANFTRHKSGVVETSISGNTITVRTSCVKEFTIRFVAGMVDYKKPVTISINGQQKFKGMIVMDKNKMLSNYLNNRDRSMLTLNDITFKL